MKIVYKDEAVKAYVKESGQLEDLRDACLDVEAEEGVKRFEVTYDDDVKDWYINY